MHFDKAMQKSCASKTKYLVDLYFPLLGDFWRLDNANNILCFENAILKTNVTESNKVGKSLEQV